MADKIIEALRLIQDDKRVDWHARGTCEAAADEIERLRAALTLISGFGGKCLFSNTRGSDGDQAYREGSHAAWEQAADIAASALKTADALNIHERGET